MLAEVAALDALYASAWCCSGPPANPAHLGPRRTHPAPVVSFRKSTVRQWACSGLQGRRKRLQRLQNAEVAAVAALCALCLVLQRTTGQPGAPGAMAHSPRPCRVLLAVHSASMGVFWPPKGAESGFSGFKASSSENLTFEIFQHG